MAKKTKKAAKPKKAAKSTKAKKPSKPVKAAKKSAKSAKAATKNLGMVPRWDLSNVYPGLDSMQFEAAVEDAKAQLDEIDTYQKTHRVEKRDDGPAQGNIDDLERVLSDLVDKMNPVRRLYGTLNAYVASFTSTDSFNQEARRIESELELLGVRLRKQEVD